MKSIQQFGTCALMLAVIGAGAAFAQDSGDAGTGVTTLSGATMTSGMSTTHIQESPDQAQIAQLKMALARAHQRLNQFSKAVTCLKNNMYIWAPDGSSTQPTVTTAWVTCDVAALNVGNGSTSGGGSTGGQVFYPGGDPNGPPTVTAPGSDGGAVFYPGGDPNGPPTVTSPVSNSYDAAN